MANITILTKLENNFKPRETRIIVRTIEWGRETALTKKLDGKDIITINSYYDAVLRIARKQFTCAVSFQPINPRSQYYQISPRLCGLCTHPDRVLPEYLEDYWDQLNKQVGGYIAEEK